MLLVRMRTRWLAGKQNTVNDSGTFASIQSASLGAERAAIHRQTVPKGFPIVQGIGIASGAGKMQTAAELAVHIMLARKAGAAGFVGFAYQRKHTTELFAPLRLGQTVIL